MKTLLSVSLLTLLLAACGGDSESKSGSENIQARSTKSSAESKEIKGCDILTESYLKSAFPGISEIVIKPVDQSSYIMRKLCGYSFKLDNDTYIMSLNLILSKKANEAFLEQTMKHFKGSELIDGVGAKAYYSEQYGIINAFGGESFVQTSAYLKDSMDMEKPKQASIKVANGMLDALAKLK